MAVAQADVNRMHHQQPARGIHITWNTSAGCVRPHAAVQQQVKEIVSQLDTQARLRELVRLVVNACPPGCAGMHTGEIGLRIHAEPEDGSGAVAVDLLFNDENGLTREVVTALPLADLRSRLLRLLRVYTVEGCAKDTFAAWSLGLSDQDLRSRLGISEQMLRKR